MSAQSVQSIVETNASGHKLDASDLNLGQAQPENTSSSSNLQPTIIKLL